ncbi:unnamed protein product [Trichobilharzia regenti]|nr:unnamed protein product [Trichobilharzia regenti]
MRIMPKLEELSHRGYNGSKEDHYLLLCLLMTSADLSDQTKSWSNTVYVAKLIYEEFFHQGDMEKSLGHNPVDSMDRERACVPNLQIAFLDYIITPLYKKRFTPFKCSLPGVDITDNINTNTKVKS